MFNPLNWFRQRKYSESEVTAVVDKVASHFVTNSTGTLTWKQLFGNHHPDDFAKDNTQMTLAAIYCAVNTYIGSITSLPRFVQKIDPATKRPVRFVKTTDHPASRIWSHYANEELSSNELLKLIVYDVLFYDGNFYAIPEYDNQGRIFRLNYIHPSRVPRGNIVRAEGGEPLSNRRKAPRGKLLYKVISSLDGDSNSAEGFTLLADEIFHIKGLIPDPQNFRSQGIMENNTRSAGLYDASEEMGCKFYTRGYTNQMFLSTEHGLSTKVRRELEETMNSTVTGGNAIEDIFKTKILEHGLKPVHVGMPLNQIQFIETRAFSVEDVARWFNMPAFLLHSVMGTGQPPADSDQLMIMWIQNGLGHFMNNIAEQFRDQVLPRSSQPLFHFDFQRLHLYKTILNDFSQALRNVFEIGGIDRLDLASLLGIHLDPTDPTNTQRYVPANLLTVDHSLLLEKKAATSVQLMEENIKQMVQDREIALEVHTEPPAPEVIPEPEEEEDDPDQSLDDSRQDKRTRAVPEDGTINLIKLSVWNTLLGLHEYELRVLNQKRKSRVADLGDALHEWYPKFHDTLNEKLEIWQPVLTQLGMANVEDLTNDWIANSRAVALHSSDNSGLIERFNTVFGFLKNEQPHNK